MSPAAPARPAPLIEVRDLGVRLAGTAFGDVTAVRGVSYSLAPGRTLAIIGESGAGKTLSCRALMGLLPRTATATGSARLDGRELLNLTEREMQRRRGGDIAMVFQDPDQALNPTMSVGRQIIEAVRRHEPMPRRAARQRAAELMELLNIPRPQERLHAYPHQLSGGMQQRVMIAIAIAGRPRILIADEMTRALDAVTQVELMAMLAGLQRELGMAIIMICHDLALAARYADDVLVMYAGAPVEYGPAQALTDRPQVPYTRALLDASPGVNGLGRGQFRPTPGRAPNLTDAPADRCDFEPRCSHSDAICRRQRPAFLAQPGGRSWACWRPLDAERPE